MPRRLLKPTFTSFVFVLVLSSCVGWQPAWQTRFLRKYSRYIFPRHQGITILFFQESKNNKGGDSREDEIGNPNYSIDSPISRIDQLQSSQRNGIINPIGSELVDAAAAVTQQFYTLLGIKSIGVDYGLVRTGLAVTVGYNPKPIAILADLNSTQLCQEIVKHCKAEHASQIIVGLPLHKNGTEAEQTSLTRMFAEKLTTVVLQQLGPKVPVFMWDERYTSKEAIARAHSQNPDQYLYGQLDADAACIILEHYYNNNGKDAQQVLVPKEVEEQCMRSWEMGRFAEEEKVKMAVEKRFKSSSTVRQEAMARARQLESEMERDGKLGQSRKQKKKEKKKREKRGPWLIPGSDN